jgi:hypothetical protein
MGNSPLPGPPGIAITHGRLAATFCVNRRKGTPIAGMGLHRVTQVNGDLAAHALLAPAPRTGFNPHPLQAPECARTLTLTLIFDFLPLTFCF